MKQQIIRQPVLLGVFFVSGASALIYQVAWQRLLFGTFGVDSESITIVVSTFMLGLGLGALLGGQLADRFDKSIITLFGLFEMGIGLFGIISPRVLTAVGDYFMGYGLSTIVLANFLLILIPASLMGATLPMLVAFLFKQNENVGVSIGVLYLSNTMGAALGAISTAIILFVFLTLNQAIYLAACGNFAAAAIIYFHLKIRGQR